MKHTKAELEERLAMERRRLEANLATIPAEDLSLPGAVGAWSVKDVLAHLAAWEALFLDWTAAGMRGETTEVPAPGYSWREIDALNQRIYEEHCHEPLDVVLAGFRATHERFVARVLELSDEQLFTRGCFPWITKLPLANWVSGYAAHDRWAKTEIRKWIKGRKD